MAKLWRLPSLLCSIALAGCSVKSVAFEQGAQDAGPDATPDAPVPPPRCDLGVCIDYGSGADGDVMMLGDADLNTDNLGASSDGNGAFPDGIAFQVMQAPAAAAAARPTPATEATPASPAAAAQ